MECPTRACPPDLPFLAGNFLPGSHPLNAPGASACAWNLKMPHYQDESNRFRPLPDPRAPIVLAAMMVPAALVAGVPLWGVLSGAVAVWGGTNAFMARKAFSDTSKMDNALPAFAQYVTDSRMEGMEIRDAVRTRSKNNDKKDALGPVLRDISKQMMFGMSLAAAAESAKTTSGCQRYCSSCFRRCRRARETTPIPCRRLPTLSRSTWNSSAR